jgi:hypothetical protein
MQSANLMPADPPPELNELPGCPEEPHAAGAIAQPSAASTTGTRLARIGLVLAGDR